MNKKLDSLREVYRGIYNKVGFLKGNLKYQRGLAQELQRVGALTSVTHSMEEPDTTYVYDVSI